MSGRWLVWFSVLIVCGCGGSGGSDSGGSGSGNGDIVYDCSVFPPAAGSPYVLPWRVGQSHFPYPHAARETSVQMYAIDFDVPIGTEVIASRAGIVVRVQESFVDGDNVFGHENYVLVQHDDGTVARYVHLTQFGALVNIGASVQQGDLIAYSGNTGNSSGPHLHFDVTAGCCAIAPDYNALPEGQTRPLNFRNAVPGSGDLSCGLRHAVSYTAAPF